MDDLLWGDTANAHQGGETLIIEEREQIERRFTPKDGTTDRVNMGEDQIDRLLGEIVEGRSFGNDVAEKGVVLLDVRLLGRTHGVAEEQRDFTIAVVIVFKGKNISELSTVVAQKDIKQRRDGDTFDTKLILEGRKPGGAFSRRLIVHEQADHKVAGGKVNRHNHLAADAANHSIEFNVALKMIISNESDEIIVGAAGLDTGRDIIDLAALPGLKLDCSGKVENRRGIIPLLKMAVDRALGAGDCRGIGHDVINVLPLFQAFGNNAVGLIKFLLVQRYTFPSFG